MKILITGANGFIAKNLISHLRETKNIELLLLYKESTITELATFIDQCDFIFHLAGVNRPKETEEFNQVNFGLTNQICKLVAKSTKKIPIIFSSSTQVLLDNEYGESKLSAEKSLETLANEENVPVAVFRLPNVFGKWGKPNYNSVVATFCFNIVNGKPIQINNPKTELTLTYIDDLIFEFITTMNSRFTGYGYFKVSSFTTNLEELSSLIYRFKESRSSLITENVGQGFSRALYATYLSYLKPQDFSYKVPAYKDDRGQFSEILKTKESGQFSFFTAHSGVTRGGHYHHTKNEKFLVVKGKARFNFKQIDTGETFTIETDNTQVEIVETIPGWAHDITNIGDSEMVVLLWANEIFDKEKPDTYSHSL